MSIDPQRAVGWLGHVNRALGRSHVPEVITTIVAAATVLLGLALTVQPDEYHRPTFRRTMMLAPPQTWGWAAILLGAAVLLALATTRRDLWWPMFGLTVWHTAWAGSITYGLARGEAIGSAPVIYGSVAVITAYLTWVHRTEPRS